MLKSASQGDVCSWGRESAPGGGSDPGGFWSMGGGSGLGVSAPGGGGVSAPRGVWSNEGISQHALRQTPLPPCGQTDACENITLAQLRCGR